MKTSKDYKRGNINVKFINEYRNKILNSGHVEVTRTKVNKNIDVYSFRCPLMVVSDLIYAMTWMCQNS